LIYFQAWVYDHFEDIGRTKADRYKKEMPRACKYEPTKGKTNQMANAEGDRSVASARRQIKVHRHICLFEETKLYSDLIRWGPTKVGYLPERVLQQFGYVQTIPRHPHTVANLVTTIEQIDD
jgi:hypothetical protein